MTFEKVAMPTLGYFLETCQPTRTKKAEQNTLLQVAAQPIDAITSCSTL